MSGPCRHLIAALLIVPRCWGFVRQVPPQQLNWKLIHNSRRVSRWSHSEDDTPLGLQEGEPIRREEVELWLDLRNTAIFPGEAIEYLRENDIGSGIVDRVVLSEDTMEKVILQQPKHDNFLYVPSRGDDLVLSCKDQSLPCGKVVTQDAGGVMFNPILAMDIVRTNGGWVFLEQVAESDEAAWMEEISSLLTFLWSSTGAGLDLVGGGLAQDVDSSKLYDTPAGNGVAIACPSGSLLMEVGKITMTLASLPTGIVTSDGGILLPSAGGPVVEDDMSSIIVPNGSSNEVDEEQLPVAFVLPLDVSLWKTAIELVTETIESNESDVDLR